jgi:hypothetical protein
LNSGRHDFSIPATLRISAKSIQLQQKIAPAISDIIADATLAIKRRHWRATIGNALLKEAFLLPIDFRSLYFKVTAKFGGLHASSAANYACDSVIFSSGKHR